jgi:hypothetical protein
MRGEEKQGKTSRHPLQPFKSQEELMEAIDRLRRYLSLLRSWDDVSTSNAEPEDRDLN